MIRKLIEPRLSNANQGKQLPSGDRHLLIKEVDPGEEKEGKDMV